MRLDVRRHYFSCSGIEFFTCCLAVLLTVFHVGVSRSSAQAQGVRFNDLIGVNRAVQPSRAGNDALLGTIIQHNRTQVNWHILEPTEGDFNSGGLFYQSANIKNLRKQYGVETLPTLGFTPAWASGTTAQDLNNSWTWRGVNYDRSVDPGGETMTMTYTNVGESTPFFAETLSINDIQLPAAAEHVPDWEEFVRQTVNTLGVPASNPNSTAAGVDYFMPWNEGHPGGPFYNGSMENYFERIHLPAVRKIRDENQGREDLGIVDKKVVFGGWIGPERLDRPQLPTLLDNYSTDEVNLWDTIDVLDVHYRSLQEMEDLRAAAARRGYGDKGIWQSEFTGVAVRRNAQGEIVDDGGTIGRDYGTVTNFYPRFARWANQHNDGDPDRYRIYWYDYYDETGVQDGTYETLVEGDNQLTPHGQALQTVGNLLGGSALHNYDAVTTDTGLGFELDESQSSIEAFRVEGEDGERLVVAVHLDDPGDGSIQVYLPELDVTDIASAERVTVWDADQTLVALPNTEDSGVLLEVATDDLTGPNGNAWDEMSVLPRTLFLNIDLVQPIPEPASLSLLAIGAAGVLSRPRRSRR